MVTTSWPVMFISAREFISNDLVITLRHGILSNRSSTLLDDGTLILLLGEGTSVATAATEATEATTNGATGLLCTGTITGCWVDTMVLVCGPMFGALTNFSATLKGSLMVAVSCGGTAFCSLGPFHCPSSFDRLLIVFCIVLTG